MDDRGRVAQSLSWIARGRPRRAGTACPPAAGEDPSFIGSSWLDRQLAVLPHRLPRAAGLIGTVVLLLASLAYGVIRGEHVSAVAGLVRDVRDEVFNRAGLRIVSIALTGNRHITREEVLAIAGITGAGPLIFVDVVEVRNRLMANPWVADVAVLKLYPGELQINIKERAAFALWQKDGAVSVIAEDGTVLEPYVAPGLLRLPLVVGAGAAARASEVIDLLDRHPAMRELVRAAVLVSERRWNLRLQNGLEVRLPEVGAAASLETLTTIERQKHLFTRDIAVIDLRLPDRVTVRLSEAAAQARIEAREKAKKKAGNA
jgi:cell division protein FtsQ